MITALPTPSAQIAASHGLISQGEESLAIFKYRLSQGNYDNNRREDLETKFSEQLNGHEVYVIPSIVKTPDDFLLGYRDIENSRIYVSEQVVKALKDNPLALAEYLFHEADCEGENHYEVIAQQQRRFPENYKGRGYVFDPEKGYLIDPETGLIAKGSLGVVLRSSITDMVENYGNLYMSIDEARAVYKEVTGKDNNDLLDLFSESYVDYGWWVVNLGLIDLFELAESAGERAVYLFKKGFQSLQVNIGLDFVKDHWSQLVELSLLCGNNVSGLYREGLPDFKHRYGKEFLKENIDTLIETARVAREKTPHLIKMLSVYREVITSRETLAEVGALLAQIYKKLSIGVAKKQLSYSLRRCNQVFKFKGGLIKKLRLLKNLVVNDSCAIALENILLLLYGDEVGEAIAKRSLQKIATAPESVDRAVELQILLKKLQARQASGGADKYDDEDGDPYARVREAMPQKGITAQSMALVSGSFSTDMSYRVSHTEGITNEKVGLVLAEKLSDLNIHQSTETQATEGAVSVLVSSAAEDIKLRQTLSSFSEYLTEEEYRSLPKDVRGLFEETRLVAITGQVYLAREPGKGTSYAHFGKAGSKGIDTLYIGTELLEYLAENNPKALNTLIKIEINRKDYRKNNQADLRTSMQVVKDAEISPEELKNLKEAIAGAEAKALIEKTGASRLAEVIMTASQDIDSRSSETVIVDGVDLGGLKGALLEAVVGQLSNKLKSEELTKDVQSAAAAIDRSDVKTGIEELTVQIEEQITEQTDGVEINLLTGTVVVHDFADKEIKGLDLKEASVRLVSRMVGRVTGDTETVFIDLKRNDVSISKVLEILSDGYGPVTEKPLKVDRIVIEKMQVGEKEFMHVSTGETAVSQSAEKARAIREFAEYVDIESKQVPVGVDVAVLEMMEPEYRKEFINRYHKVLAIVGEQARVDNIEELYGRHAKHLERNRMDYELDIEENRKMLITGREQSVKVDGATVLRVDSSVPATETSMIMDLACYIADVGKEEARKSSEISRLVRAILKKMYEEGEVPEEFLQENALEALLDNDDNFAFPPIKQDSLQDMESYLRAQRFVETMA